MLKHCDVRFWLQAGYPISTGPMGSSDTDAADDQYFSESFPELGRLLNYPGDHSTDSEGSLPDLLPPAIDSPSLNTSGKGNQSLKDHRCTAWYRLVAKSVRYDELQHLLYRLLPYRNHPIFTVLGGLERLHSSISSAVPDSSLITNVLHNPSKWLLEDMSVQSLFPSSSSQMGVNDPRDVTWDAELFQRPYLSFTPKDAQRLADAKQRYIESQVLGGERELPARLDDYMEELSMGRLALNQSHLEEISSSILFNINRLLFHYTANDQYPQYSLLSDTNKYLMFNRDFVGVSFSDKLYYFIQLTCLGLPKMSFRFAISSGLDRISDGFAA